MRLGVSAVLGAVAGLVVALSWLAEAAVVSGWIITAVAYCAWTWAGVVRMGAADTASHAMEEDPGRGATDLVLIMASLASIIGVGVLLAAGSHQGASAVVEAGLGVLCVAASWFVVHVLFTMRYARLYYERGARGVDFSQDEDPDYHDFAYLAFTLGMTYQVSDTTIRARTIRRSALRHALLSYLLGAVVLASAVNLMVSIAAGG